MRGEHPQVSYPARPGLGSSPHARGAPPLCRPFPDEPGIIPACAGSTRRPGGEARHQGDHPRMRGEHTFASNPELDSQGSSPHARGAREVTRMATDAQRIIPACAGSTRSMACPDSRWRDHPRMRGEHSLSAFSFSARLGSSPHARGALSVSTTASAFGRIIPACAGSTRLRGGFACRLRDHPRMRGEHFCLAGKSSAPGGSSPHARGAPWRVLIAGGLVGIIPACAGSTRTARPRTAWPGDHPRMRGEHT